MKTMCSPIYHHSGFVAIDARVHEFPQNHCGNNQACTLFP